MLENECYSNTAETKALCIACMLFSYSQTLSTNYFITICIAEEFKLVKIPRDFRSDPAKLVGLELHNRTKLFQKLQLLDYVCYLSLSVACLFI